MAPNITMALTVPTTISLTTTIMVALIAVLVACPASAGRRITDPILADFAAFLTQELPDHILHDAHRNPIVSLECLQEVSDELDEMEASARAWMRTDSAVDGDTQRELVTAFGDPSRVNPADHVRRLASDLFHRLWQTRATPWHKATMRLSNAIRQLLYQLRRAPVALARVRPHLRRLWVCAERMVDRFGALLTEIVHGVGQTVAATAQVGLAQVACSWVPRDRLLALVPNLVSRLQYARYQQSYRAFAKHATAQYRDYFGQLFPELYQDRYALHDTTIDGAEGDVLLDDPWAELDDWWSVDSSKTSFDSSKTSFNSSTTSLDSPKSSFDSPIASVDSSEPAFDSSTTSFDSPKSSFDSPIASFDSSNASFDSPKTSDDVDGDVSKGLPTADDTLLDDPWSMLDEWWSEESPKTSETTVDVDGDRVQEMKSSDDAILDDLWSILDDWRSEESPKTSEDVDGGHAHSSLYCGGDSLSSYSAPDSIW